MCAHAHVHRLRQHVKLAKFEDSEGRTYCVSGSYCTTTGLDM